MSTRQRRRAARVATAPSGAPDQPVSRAARRALSDAGTQRPRSRWRTILLASGGILVAAFAVGAFLLSQQSLASPQSPADWGVAMPIEGDRSHVTQGSPLTQKERPPSSGPHYPTPAPYGLSTTPILPGNWIHDLEHGAEVILYKCTSQTDCTSIGNQIKSQVYDSAPLEKYGEVKMVITPYQDMDEPFAAVSWGHVLALQSIDKTAMLAFYSHWVDQGPEDVP